MAEKTKFDVHTNTCQKCKFHDVLTDVQSRQQTGICRRHPPTTFAQAVPVPAPEGMSLMWKFTTMWTMVKDADWCGEFQQKVMQ